MRGVGDGLLLIGLAVSVFSLNTVMTRLADHPADIASFRSERSTNAAAFALSTALRDRLGGQGARGIVSSDSVDHHDRGGQGDARLYLRDAAIAAHRPARAGPGQGETRTDLWINAPESIGSTSPPDANPVEPFVKE
jgi:hypothetical protein